MVLRLGINGFGRIGRAAFRCSLNSPDVEVVAINDLIDSKLMVNLLKYDTVYGKLDKKIKIEAKDNVKIDNKSVDLFHEKDPAAIQWNQPDVDYVLECTGLFTRRADASKHLTGGAKRVIISAPSKGSVDLTVVMGVNHTLYDPKDHFIVSNASCTTNCLGTMLKPLHDSFIVDEGFLTTIHSYTSTQKLVDGPHRDPRRSRAAAQNIIPTSTGATRAIGLILPDLVGKINGLAFRVPTITVSIVDLVVKLSKSVSKEEVNLVFKESSEKDLKNILSFSEEPLVSSDYSGDYHSCIIDGLSTMTVGQDLVKVLGWYDNEMGYAMRLIDLAKHMKSKET